MRSLLLFILLFLVSMGCATTQVPTKTVTIITDDKVKLSAAYYPAPAPGAPGVILLPDTRCNHKHFGHFPYKLNDAGFAVLAMDLRFKELIAQVRDRDEQISLIKKQDLYAPVKYDIKSAMDFLTNQEGVNPRRVALIGTSLGSRLGLISGVRYNVRALILVSLSGETALPGGETISNLLEEYGDRPILFMTSEKDWGGNYTAAENNKIYFASAKGKKTLQIWPGTGHGVAILRMEEASDFVISWLKNNL
jgi:dienelactone hydrolase